MPFNQGGSSGAGGAIALLTNTVLGAPAASIDFQNITGGNHLMIVTYLRDDSASTSATTCLVRFNNDSGANYNFIGLKGNNATASASNALAQTSGFGTPEVQGGAVASYFGAGTIWVPFYATTAGFKTASSNGSSVAAVAADTLTVQQGWVWKNTAAITRVTLLPNTATNFVAGSGASLYVVT